MSAPSAFGTDDAPRVPNMEGINDIALSIPIFLLLIGVEWLVAFCRRRRVYRLNDALDDLHCGVLQQVRGVFIKVVVSGAEVWVYEIARVVSIPPSATWAGVACFLLVNHQYDWFHRVSHESNLPRLRRRRGERGAGRRGRRLRPLGGVALALPSGPRGGARRLTYNERLSAAPRR
ncbi:MAG: hypothetical protein AAFX50_22695 [Acidobacteriota bacterium]